jgi:hypothetical protein
MRLVAAYSATDASTEHRILAPHGMAPAQPRLTPIFRFVRRYKALFEI